MQDFSQAVVSFPIAPVVIVVLVLVVLALVALFSAVLYLGTRLKYLTSPVYDHALKEAQKKAGRVIEDATEQARALRAKAEMEAAEVLQNRKQESDTLQQEYTQKIKETAEHSKEALHKQTMAITHMSDEIMEAFNTHAQSTQQALTSEVEMIRKSFAEERGQLGQALRAAGERIQKEHEVLIVENQKYVRQTLEKEMEGVREAIKTYQQERFRLVDQQIVQMVEEAVRIALNRTLSMKEHADIIKESLNQAKQRGIFGK